MAGMVLLGLDRVCVCVSCYMGWATASGCVLLALCSFFFRKRKNEVVMGHGLVWFCGGWPVGVVVADSNSFSFGLFWFLLALVAVLVFRPSCGPLKTEIAWTRSIGVISAV